MSPGTPRVVSRATARCPGALFRRFRFRGLAALILALGLLTACGRRESVTNIRPGEIQPQRWPGSPAVEVADAGGVFNENLSGLAYESSGSGFPGVLWAARNGPASVFRLVWDGSIWTPDTENDWGTGKLVRYTGGTGEPDAEGLTLVESGTSVSLYLATERDNQASNVSRNSVLRFDASGVGRTLVATHEWNLTSDIPETGANRGLEAITFIPDDFLVAAGFRDESNGARYDPIRYRDHAGGLFFVGVEATGMIHAFALDHTSGGFTRIADIPSGLTGVMGLEFDAETGVLWAICDDGCGGRATTLQIDTAAGSDTAGRFVVIELHDRPAGMPNLNNEGFALAPMAECVDGIRPVFWSDDDETGGHSVRRGGLICSTP